MNSIYAIFGGSFDPIHYGHLNIINGITKEIKLKKIIILPNYNPTYQNKSITHIYHRINMIRLAISDHIKYELNLIECEKKIIYSIHTLKIIRTLLGKNQPIIFIIGEDNLINIDTWKQWKNILKFCHLIICPRKNSIKKIIEYKTKIKKWIKKNKIIHTNLLNKYSCGYIFFSKINNMKISSTIIRKIYNKNKCNTNLVPKLVEQYIQKNNLY